MVTICQKNISYTYFNNFSLACIYILLYYALPLSKPGKVILRPILRGSLGFFGRNNFTYFHGRNNDTKVQVLIACGQANDITFTSFISSFNYLGALGKLVLLFGGLV